jgi:Kef-type K+ transport system membrane component KefB
MIILIALLSLMFLLRSALLEPFSNPGQGTSIALGFILIFAFLFGKRMRPLRLPQITGFIIAGILCGPYVLRFLNEAEVRNLQLLDGLALSLIALTAGGEMRFDRIKKSIRSISSIVFFQTVFIISGFVLLGIIGRYVFPFFSESTVLVVFSISLILGTLATATSPSTTIAIITETRAKGKFTDLVLSAAVVKDFFVIVVFAFCLSFSKSLAPSAQQFDFGLLLHILREIGGSILIGGLVGGGIILYLKFIKRDVTVFIVSIAFFTYQISQSYGYHPLLICLTAGFFVENLSEQGDQLIHAIERVSLPIYVVFFAISGASLDLGALRKTWLLAVVCVVWRGILKFSGTYVGAKLARDEPGVQKYSWAGFISQAGVALGMAIIVERTFPEWGGEFKALVLAIIAINQVIGPVFLQRLLVKVGEAGKREGNG